MGEIADGMINGDFDFFTGEYIGNGFGIPRTRNRSLPWERREKRQKEHNPRKGVLTYIHRTYIGRSRMPKATKIAKHFFSEMGSEFISDENMFEQISSNFKMFVEWMNTNKEKMYQTY